MTTQYNILVVDDEIEFRDTLKDILELKGYIVSTAGEGSDAVNMVAQNHYHLVIMDVRMPEMDGISALQLMLKRQPQLPVFIVSAYRLMGDEKETVEATAKAVFNKPLNIDTLLKTVDEVLNR